MKRARFGEELKRERSRRGDRQTDRAAVPYSRYAHLPALHPAALPLLAACGGKGGGGY